MTGTSVDTSQGPPSFRTLMGGGQLSPDAASREGLGLGAWEAPALGRDESLVQL